MSYPQGVPPWGFIRVQSGSGSSKAGAGSFHIGHDTSGSSSLKKYRLRCWNIIVLVSVVSFRTFLPAVIALVSELFGNPFPDFICGLPNVPRIFFFKCASLTVWYITNRTVE